MWFFVSLRLQLHSRSQQQQRESCFDTPKPNALNIEISECQTLNAPGWGSARLELETYLPPGRRPPPGKEV